MRKVPIFNKKEEMLANLCEFEVPTPRAVWYIKMKAAYDSAISEMNKTKKRPQHPDPSQDWTHALTRYLRDQLQEILTSSNDEVRVESSVPFKQWTYSLELCEHMYNQGLLGTCDDLKNNNTKILCLFNILFNLSMKSIYIYLNCLLEFVYHYRST